VFLNPETLRSAKEFPKLPRADLDEINGPYYGPQTPETFSQIGRARSGWIYLFSALKGPLFTDQSPRAGGGGDSVNGFYDSPSGVLGAR